MGKRCIINTPRNCTGREQFSFTLPLLYTQAVSLYVFLTVLYKARVTASNISENKNQVFNIISFSRQQVV